MRHQGVIQNRERGGLFHGKRSHRQILDQIFDAEWQGRRGEKLTERELKWVKAFGRDGKALRNVYVPKGDGETSEIDAMVITQKGIFVIESKNYSGWIFGNEADRYWTVVLEGGHKNRFYNRIMQNRGHVKWLANYLADDTPLFSIVAFSVRCELKKVMVSNKEVRVIKRDRLHATVRDTWDTAEDVLNEAAASALHDRLMSLTDVDEAARTAYVTDIEQRYKKKKPAHPQQSAQSKSVAAVEALPHVCPKCGGTLVLRIAKRGSNAGNQFYGCSNYPKCRFTKNI